jgi:SAM-dependent methyltransferase
MSNENTTIHEFDFNLICEYFSHLERQGPGSPEATKTALGFIRNLDNQSNIADIGCGTGGQTIVLANNTPGMITGIDLFPTFITLFNQQVANHQLQSRVKGEIGNMENLPFEEESLDLIWSEGAIYNIGFQRGLAEWRKFLKPGGYLAVSEASWFTEERPKEIEEFWHDAYPEIDTIANKVAQMQQAGYVPVAAFILPEECWIEHFYQPQHAVQEMFLKQHSNNKTAEAFISNERREEQLYHRHKAHYGYVFYIGMKR